MAAALRVQRARCAGSAFGGVRPVEWAQLILTGVVAGLIGSIATYIFSLRQDKEARRRQRIVGHLIEAYETVEYSTQRHPLSEDAKRNLESAIASIFLLGSEDSAKAANKFASEMRQGNGDSIELLRILRGDLRAELGLRQHKVDPVFIRFAPSNEETAD